eukprot:172432-Rhodomonas_salina.1
MGNPRPSLASGISLRLVYGCPPLSASPLQLCATEPRKWSWFSLPRVAAAPQEPILVCRTGP